MGAERDDVIRLHGSVGPHTVTVGGDDEPEARQHATERVAAALGSPPAVILTGSCTSALEAAATLVDIGPGDEVVVPAFTFPSTAIAFARRGARIRFADADPATGNVDPASVEQRAGERTRAIVVMHYAGVAADVAAIEPVLGARGADLVEDAAQGFFATLDGVALGRLGRFGALSFHRTKNVSSLEGGALVVNHPADVAAAHVAVDKGTNRHEFDAGRVTSYEWTGIGSAARMPEAAVRLLTADLVRAEAAQAHRHAVWDRYQAELADWAADHGVAMPTVPAGREQPAHLFFLVLPDGWSRAAFVAELAGRGIAAARHYGSLPASRYGREIADPDDRCPVAHRLGEQLVRIPLHADLTTAEVDRVVEAVVATRPPPDPAGR